MPSCMPGKLSSSFLAALSASSVTATAAGAESGLCSRWLPKMVVTILHSSVAMLSDSTAYSDAALGHTPALWMTLEQVFKGATCSSISCAPHLNAESGSDTAPTPPAFVQMR